MLCDANNALLILDEIFTGFGRTGTFFATQYEQVEPDLLCMGKALGGGFPISAVAGRAAIMDAWKPSQGEALHTSTHLGNPLGCAAALAVFAEMERLRILERAQSLGEIFAEHFHDLSRFPGMRDARGRGALWALECENGAAAHRIVVRALTRGLILLQAGPGGTAIQLTPPLIMEDEQLDHALRVLSSVVDEVRSHHE
jgi:4-aminobutyrate aminotransferase-like enzyme